MRPTGSIVPELPDITVYLQALEARALGQTLNGVRLMSPFLLRTTEPPLATIQGRKVQSLRRLGKRLAFGFEDGLWLVLHMMIAGRLHWKAAGAKLSGRQNLAAFEFPNGTLVLTEAGTKKRASLHLVAGKTALRKHDRGGLEVLDSTPEAFGAALTRENHTLKRALTDPRLFSGIGNTYSDEILHAAQLSPVQLRRNFRPKKSTVCTLPRNRRWRSGPSGCARKPATASQKRSPRFVRRWPCTASMGNPVRHAARRCNGFATRTMRPTIARAADRRPRVGRSRSVPFAQG